jgi:hypothetical protein
VYGENRLALPAAADLHPLVFAQRAVILAPTMPDGAKAVRAVGGVGIRVAGVLFPADLVPHGLHRVLFAKHAAAYQVGTVLPAPGSAAANRAGVDDNRLPHPTGCGGSGLGSGAENKLICIAFIVSPPCVFGLAP